MIHPANIDGARHKSGLFNEKVTASLDETDQWIGQIMEALDDAGVREETNFFLISDHGQMDIKRAINMNVFLADNGLIHADEKGNLVNWDAYCFSAGMSAHVFLKNPEDSSLYNKVYELFNHLCKEGIYGISRVYTEPEARAEEHLGGAFSFVLETDGYTAFSDDWKRPVVKNYDFTDYRYGRATHGYLPEKGPQPVLAAKGPDIKNGVVLEKSRLIDLAPTFAKLMGVEFPEVDGTVINQILNSGKA
jgi:predicted AlkP superfamily pyrophosphatase or phosphodiesterase